ncbi:MAG: hypothetical protein ACRCVA_35265 [Phreatobacter sp.]
MRRLVRPFIVIAAIIILIETWLWERIGPQIRRVIDALPFARLKQAIHDGLERLPPYATLGVFIVPALLLIPFKLAGLSLIGHGHVILGCGVFLLAKVVGVGLEAFLFEACKPKLLQIGWFVRVYDTWNRWVVWAHGYIDPVKKRLQAYTRLVRGGRSGRAFKLLMRFRRIQRERAAEMAGAAGA